MEAHGFTVYDMIVRGASVYGAAPAVIQGERMLSFREFHRRVDSLAAGLTALGVGRGERLCVLAQNDAAYLELYGACARQGIVAYPINWRLTASEVERVLERAGPAMFVADASTLPVVAEWPAAKRSVAHWYQLGESAAAGFTPFARLYRDSPAPAVGAG
jgi:fatty-acyl-CoA synthase